MPRLRAARATRRARLPLRLRALLPRAARARITRLPRAPRRALAYRCAPAARVRARTPRAASCAPPRRACRICRAGSAHRRAHVLLLPRARAALRFSRCSHTALRVRRGDARAAHRMRRHTLYARCRRRSGAPPPFTMMFLPSRARRRTHRLRAPAALTIPAACAVFLSARARMAFARAPRRALPRARAMLCLRAARLHAISAPACRVLRLAFTTAPYANTGLHTRRRHTCRAWRARTGLCRARTTACAAAHMPAVWFTLARIRVPLWRGVCSCSLLAAARCLPRSVRRCSIWRILPRAYARRAARARMARGCTVRCSGCVAAVVCAGAHAYARGAARRAASLYYAACNLRRMCLFVRFVCLALTFAACIPPAHAPVTRLLLVLDLFRFR